MQHMLPCQGRLEVFEQAMNSIYGWVFCLRRHCRISCIWHGIRVFIPFSIWPFALPSTDYRNAVTQAEKKCQNCHAMTCECHQRVALGNSLTVWYSQCLSTKNVYGNVSIWRAQRPPAPRPTVKWGEQWSRPWKWSWCARYIASKRSFRSRQSLTKDCKHVGSTFKCHCHWWIGSMFKTFSELLAENGNWALCVLTAGMSASCVSAYKNFQPRQLPSPLKLGDSANSTSSPLHQVCRRDLYFVWKSPKMAPCAYSHKMPPGTFGLVITLFWIILIYFTRFYRLISLFDLLVGEQFWNHFMVDMVDTCRLKPTTPIAASKFEVQLYLEVPRDVVLLLETLMTFRGSQDFPCHSRSSSSHLLSLKKCIPCAWNLQTPNAVKCPLGQDVLHAASVAAFSISSGVWSASGRQWKMASEALVVALCRFLVLNMQPSHPIYFELYCVKFTISQTHPLNSNPPMCPLQRNNICTFHTAPAAQKLLGSVGQKTERPRTRRTKRRRRRRRRQKKKEERRRKNEEGRRKTEEEGRKKTEEWRRKNRINKKEKRKNKEERRKKKEEGRRKKKEERIKKKEEGRRKKKEERIKKKEEGRRKKEEGRNKKEERRRKKKEERRKKKEERRKKKEERRRKKEEGRRKKEEGRRKKEEGRRKKEERKKENQKRRKKKDTRIKTKEERRKKKEEIRKNKEQKRKKKEENNRTKKKEERRKKKEERRKKKEERRKKREERRERKKETEDNRRNTCKHRHVVPWETLKQNWWL